MGRAMTLAATVLADLVLRGVRFLRRADLIGYQPAALVTAAERELAALFKVSRRMVSIRLGKWWSEQSSQPSLF